MSILDIRKEWSVFIYLRDLWYSGLPLLGSPPFGVSPRGSPACCVRAIGKSCQWQLFLYSVSSVCPDLNKRSSHPGSWWVLSRFATRLEKHAVVFGIITQ